MTHDQTAKQPSQPQRSDAEWRAILADKNAEPVAFEAVSYTHLRAHET